MDLSRFKIGTKWLFRGTPAEILSEPYRANKAKGWFVRITEEGHVANVGQLQAPQHRHPRMSKSGGDLILNDENYSAEMVFAGISVEMRRDEIVATYCPKRSMPGLADA